MTDANQPHHSPGPAAGSRLRAFLFRRTIARDVVQGIIAGGVLAIISAVLVINVVDRHMQITANGWSNTLQCGGRRTGILLRAACANDIAALNVPAEEVYWQAFVDGAGHRLNGLHDYMLHFPPGGLPPNTASWSLTMGDWRRFMVDNPIHRYSVGGRSGLVPNGDGSIDIAIRNTPPAVHEANWLPAPAGNFMLWLRVYQPGAAILNGMYRAPPVVEVNGVRK